jgi:hypothetical protein
MSPASGRGKGEEAWGRAEEMAAIEATAAAAVNFILMSWMVLLKCGSGSCSVEMVS